ncbi:class B sortase [[Ruminococcus] torques]|nr:class B sortase [[Ruminococcus] torques]
MTFDPSSASIRCSWLAYDPGGWDRLSGHAEQPGRSGVLSAEGLPGNYDINGSLFLQADCILGESKNLTIYGHNMNSGAMFGNLDRYASYDYWKAHPRVFFQTPEGMEEYRIAAVLKADVSMFDFQQTSFHSPQELEAYAAQAKALSLFETGVAGAGCETTLTLVTCSYEWKEAWNILVAVKAEPER